MAVTPKKELVARIAAEREAGQLCAERGFHRYYDGAADGSECEQWESCLQCCFPRALERRFVPHINALDDANHQPSTVKLDSWGKRTAQCAQNEVELAAAMARTAVEGWT